MALKTHLPPLLANDDAGTGRACFQAGGPEGGVMILFGRHRVMKRIIPLKKIFRPLKPAAKHSLTCGVNKERTARRSSRRKEIGFKVAS